MKTTFFILSMIASLCFTTAHAAKDPVKRVKKTDVTACLRISGVIANNNENEGECYIELIGQNKAIDTIILPQGEKKFEFMLGRNTEYMIRISKKGYLNKTVSVNTHILTLENELHSFNFETGLMAQSELANLNKNMLNYPAAIIQYDYQSDSFSHNEEYTDLIKKELYNTQNTDNNVSEQTNRPLSSKPHSFLR